MDIFSPTIIDNAIITGSNNASLLQVSSPSATSAFFISGSGNIGIGTTLPLSTLSVAGGNININDGYSIGGNALGSYVPFLRYNNTGAGVPSSSFGHTTAYITSLGGGVFGTNDLIFYAGGLTQTEIVRIVGSTGFVGIGESSPSAKLEIKGSGATSATTAFRVENSNASASLTILDDGTSAFNTSHLYVSSSGNIGIGTTSPVANLQLSRAGNAAFFLEDTTMTNPFTGIGFNPNVTNRTSATWVGASAGSGGFQLNGFRGNSNGSVVNIQGHIGVVSPTQPVINIIGWKTDGGTGRTELTGTEKVLQISSGNSALMTIQGNGNVGIGTLTPTNTLQVVGGITATSITASIISASSGITGSLLGTSSWAQSASNAINAQTASFLPVGTYQITSSWAQSASNAINAQTASFLPVGTYQITSSWAQSASNAINAQTASFLPVGTYQITSSWAVSASNSINARTSSNIFPAITNNTSSYVLTATGNGTINGNSNLTFDGSNLTLGSFTGIVLPSNGYVKGPQSTVLLGGNATYNVSLPNDFITATASLGGLSNTRIQLLTNIESIPGGYDSGSIFFKTPSGSGMTYTNEGRLGIGISNPTNTLQIQGNVSASSYTGSLFGTSSWAINALTASFVNTASTNAFVQNGNSFGTTAVLGTNDTQDLQFETSGSVRMAISSSGNVGIGTTAPLTRLHISGANSDSLLRIQSPASASIMFVSGSGNVGIGTNLPSAELHISGASADSLLRVGSPTNSDILFVNGNGRVGINTTSSMAFFSGSGGVFGSGEGNIVPTLTIFQSSSATGLNAAGLQIVGSGSSALAAARLNILTMGDKYAYLNIGTSGSGTENNYWEFAKRPSAAAHNLLLSNYSNGVYQSSIMSLSPGANTSTIGSSNQILLEGSTGYIGLQTNTPGTSDWIHLHSKPSDGNYINIDATQTSNSPPLTAATAKTGYGITTNSYFLAEPDYWMEIKLDGVIVLVPCYLPA